MHHLWLLTNIQLNHCVLAEHPEPSGPLIFYLPQEGLHRIKTNVEKSKQIQNVMRAVELRDRSMQEANFERVNFWSGLQLFVMVSVAVTHVLMIRGLFQDKSTMRGGQKVRT